LELHDFRVIFASQVTDSLVDESKQIGQLACEDARGLPCFDLDVVVITVLKMGINPLNCSIDLEREKI
jgi:hypothetical protein